ncbi:MAG TPA: DNA mismatch repair endonuclease MutL [Candidatus Eremiobacteraceae bacterium]|nr:DNA mismatch repair endonuclease MutL [Candidatus Eremiobacteraceae bacterium]
MSGPSIRVLDEATIAQIAAGEVIERPVSVVKELVENSLDAGASSIVVDCADGGRASITVTDDGDGIARNEMALAFARHATSKLISADDLFSIATLGFRGEGLASIAAAGSVELVSRTRADDIGARIEARGVTVGEPAAIAAPLGTKVTVRDLFALTPARREFLKSGRAEFSRIASLLGQLSLGHPRVAFTLKHDGRDVWTLQAVDDPIDRLEVVFGRGARGALVAVEEEGSHSYELVSGHISAPGRDRSNRNGQVFFVNGRLVRSAALSSAWLAGYGSFGMTGRYPYGALSVKLAPGDVDVNVHPTKIEVRFANQASVFDAVRRAVARTLRATDSVRPFAVRAIDIAANGDAEQPRNGAAAAVDHEGRPLHPTTSDDLYSQLSFAPPSTRRDVRVLGQIERTFIVAASDGEMIVIDQHAAHERIAYEAIADAAGATDTAAPLLFPSVIELTPARAAVLHDAEADLAAAGVVVEPFGEGAYRIVSLPAGYEKRRFDLDGLLDDLGADDAPREGVAHRNRILATIACHSVVRAGEALSPQEQASLYERLIRCREPHSCPHGRPTMLRLDRAALAKAFKRV